MAYKGMSIDQRRAVGIKPGKLIVPPPLVDMLQSIARVTQLIWPGSYECAQVTLHLRKEPWNRLSYIVRIAVCDKKVERTCLLCHDEVCNQVFEW